MAARKILVILAGVFFGYAWYAAFTTSLTDFGVAMALCGACVTAWGCVWFVQRRNSMQRRAAMRRHPVMWRQFHVIEGDLQ